jgi:hypothetical protein
MANTQHHSRIAMAVGRHHQTEKLAQYPGHRMALVALGSGVEMNEPRSRAMAGMAITRHDWLEPLSHFGTEKPLRRAAGAVKFDSL